VGIFERIEKIDRKLIFLTVFLAAALPMIFPFSMDVSIKHETERFFEAIDALQKGDAVILSMDYSPETRPEIDPMSEGVLMQCFRKGVIVIGLVNTVPNIPIGEAVMKRVAGDCGAIYGRDYVFLGFRPEARAVIINFSDEIRKAFPGDYYGTLLDDLPAMKSIHNFDDIALAVVTTSDDVSLEWLLTANSRFNVKVIMGIASNFYPSFTPYIESKQILGALGGMKGGAEYEKLLKRAGVASSLGDATAGMATQSSVHLLIITYIVLGNIGYLALRRRKGRKGRE